MRALNLIAGLMLALLATVARGEPLIVFAASSLKEPLDRIAAEFGDVTVAYGGSGTLARQIERGAPADIVVLAHPDWMAWMDERDLLRGEVVPVAGNRLVFVSRDPEEITLTPDSLSKRLGDGRLGIGQTLSVPAGVYARQALETLGLWEDIADRLAESESVRATLALAQRGAVPLAIVYESDARIAPDLAVVATMPPESHAPIRYVASVTSRSRHAEADRFLTALASERARATFAEAGFLPLDPS